MITMQSKILDHIRAMVEEKGLEFIKKPEFVNTGTVRVMQGFKTLLSFGYDFQDDYVTMWFYGSNTPIIKTCGFTDKNCKLHWQCNYNDLNYQIKVLDQFMASELEETF